MSITAYGSGAYRAIKSQNFVETRSELDVLQRQLATKKKSETYGGLGLDRRVSLDFNAKVERIDSLLEGIDLADVNVKLISQSLSGYSAILTDFAKLTNDSKNSTAGGLYNPTVGGQSVSQTLAESQLTQTIDMLNTKVNGRYLFAGRMTDSADAVVITAQAMFDGEGGVDGLRAMVAERKAADLGVAPDTGRLAVGGGATSTVTLTETGGNAFYGFNLNASGALAASSLSPSFTITNTATAISIDVATQPAVGEIVKIPLSLPDGTTELIELRVRAPGSSSEKDTFEVGADTTATAANMRIALRDSVDKVAKTALVAGSAMIASENFFAGTAAAPPLRVPGPTTPALATAAPVAGATPTVRWYLGDENPLGNVQAIRATSAVQVGEQQRIGLGIQANERPFQIGLAAMAAFAVESFAANDPVNEPYPREHYAALAQRTNTKSKPSQDGDAASSIITEFGSKQKQLVAAKQQQTTTKTYYEATLTTVEGVTSEEVAVQILALQTQLQATYQTTSILSKLTLTNYL